jgi:hypothetical protein
MLESPATTPNGRAERRGIRVLGAVLLLAAAVIHVIELQGAETGVLIVGFALSALSTLAAALLLLSRGPRLGWLVGGGAAGLTFLAYVLSRSVGLPGDHEDIGNWGEPLGIASLVAEGVVVLAAVWALTDAHRVSARIATEEIKSVTPGLTEGTRGSAPLTD